MPPEITEEELKALKDAQSERDSLKAEYEKLKATPPPKKDPPSEGDQTLTDKVRKEREEKDRKDTESRSLESSLRFNLMSQEFLKTHEALLPKEIGDIFKVAEKERYDTAIERANATKAAIIQSFFSVQSNLDLLTSTHKSALEDYLKLTKTGREDRAQHVFENIFEPALQMLKQVKKAEELMKSKGGMSQGSKSENEYKAKLMDVSKKHYLGEKS